MREQASILVVEDELITASSITELLEAEEYLVAGVARDAAAALRLFHESTHTPAVVICDINIAGSMNGIDLATRLKKEYGCEVVFLTAYSDAKTLQAAFKTEPVMYVVKPYTDKQLLVAVQLAFHRSFQGKAIGSGLPALQLTEREREIAMLIAQGLTSKQIAGKLFIALETVKTHRRRMLSKNNINSFPQLIYQLNAGA